VINKIVRTKESTVSYLK